MADPLQRVSSVPLPAFQTQHGKHDPLPVDSPETLERHHEAVEGRDDKEKNDQFEAYLNQSGVTTLEKDQGGGRFDPVSHITADSVYTQPDDKTQF